MFLFSIDKNDISNLKKLSRNVLKMPSFIEKWAKTETEEIMQNSFRKTFNEGQSGAWKGLADSTQRNREWVAEKFGLSIGPSSPILRRFGLLRESILSMKPIVKSMGTSIDVSWGIDSLKKSGAANAKSPYGGTVMEKFIYNQGERPMVTFRNEDTKILQTSLQIYISNIINKLLK